MKFKKNIIIFLSHLFLLSQLSMANDDPIDTPFLFTDPIATYADEVINKEDFDSFLLAVFGYPVDSAADKEQARQFVSAFLRENQIRLQAKEKGLETDPRFVSEVKAIEFKIAKQIIVEQFLSQVIIEEQSLEEMYDEYLAQKDTTEYKIYHIVTNTLDDALAVTTRYSENGNFLSFINQLLNNQRENIYQGGIFGDDWIELSNINSDFSDIFKELSLNELSQPYLLYDTYYLFYLKEQRTTTPWSFEQLKESFQNTIEQQQLDAYLKAQFPIPEFELGIPQE